LGQTKLATPQKENMGFPEQSKFIPTVPSMNFLTSVFKSYRSPTIEKRVLCAGGRHLSDRRIEATSAKNELELKEADFPD
jgi:hypothetical protein